MLENISPEEVRLQKENEELRAKIGRALASIDAVNAMKFKDQYEEVIASAIRETLNTLADKLRQ